MLYETRSCLAETVTLRLVIIKPYHHKAVYTYLNNASVFNLHPKVLHLPCATYKLSYTRVSFEIGNFIHPRAKLNVKECYLRNHANLAASSTSISLLPNNTRFPWRQKSICMTLILNKEPLMKA